VRTSGLADISFQRSDWMSRRFGNTYGLRRRKTNDWINYKCSNDMCHFEWLTVTNDRFERFALFKPPAVPEVYD
jgi:hypothetical protein